MSYVRRGRGGPTSLIDARKVPIGPAEINYSDPLSRGLKAFFVPGGNRFDFVGNTPDPTFSNASIVPTTVGPAVFFNNTGDISVANCDAIGNALCGPITLFSLCYFVNFTNTHNLVSKTNSNIANPIDIQITSPSGNCMIVRGNGSSYTGFQSIPALSATWQTLMFTANADNSVYTFYRDAVSYGGSPLAGALTATNNTNALKFGKRIDGYDQMNGYVALLAFWDRVLSAEEAVQLTQAPFRVLVPFRRRPWISVSSGTNITLVKQPWLWAGTAAPVNAKQMLPATKQPWVWSPQAPNVNAKTMFAAVSKPLVWAPGVPPVNAKTMLQATKAPWVWSGNAANVTNGTAITLVQQAWVWAGTALNVNAKTMISAVSQVWAWSATAAAVNAKTAIAAVKAPWVWAGQAATVTAQTSLTLVKQAWVWAGNVPGVTYIQHASVVGVSWIWRGIRLRGSKASSQGVVGGVLSGILRGVMQLPSRWMK